MSIHYKQHRTIISPYSSYIIYITWQMLVDFFFSLTRWIRENAIYLIILIQSAWFLPCPAHLRLGSWIFSSIRNQTKPIEIIQSPKQTCSAILTNTKLISSTRTKMNRQFRSFWLCAFCCSSRIHSHKSSNNSCVQTRKKVKKNTEYTCF